MTAVPISELASTTTLLSCEEPLFLDFAPLLPSSTVVSVFSLPAAEFESVHCAEAELHVVLPRELIKRAFSLLRSLPESSAKLALDSLPCGEPSGDAPSSGTAPAVSPAVCITVGDQATLRCSKASRAHKSSVLSFNEQLKMCKAFRSWIEALCDSDVTLQWELEFLVGSTISVSAAAGPVWSACALRRVGDQA